uniref:aminotransferase class III-fold pyridoxal phosphate-dependent enzyme n=1 Tax=Sutterella wadsworthensis TaxID=40545 RepID=UPI00266F6E8D
PCAAILFEAVQGEGGVRPIGQEFASCLQEVCRKHDLLLMADEVQLGNGRSGSLYGYMNYGLQPDVVSTAKGIGGGLPLGVTMFGERVADVFHPGDHGTTFGGNPVCCAGAVNILSRIDDRLLEGVRERSDYLRRTLQAAPGIRSVTGMGLMLGLEIDIPAREFAERALREGVLVIDAAGRLQVVNDQARKILAKAHLPSDVLGQPVDRAIPHTRLLEVVRTGRAENDAEQNLGGVVIITNRVPLVVSGKIMGAVATFRDLSDMMELAEELTGAKKWIEALRVRAHNYRNTLHVINGLVKNQQYPELERYVEELRIADEVHNGRIARLIKDQVLAAFLQSKVARAAELGIELDVEPDSHADEIPDAPFRQALLSVVGNLLDNAMDAVNESEERCVRIRITSGQPIWSVEVSDSGCGFKGDPMQYFRKGVTTKGEGHGYGLYLVARAVHAYNGSIEIESNYPAGTVLKIVMQAAGPE